MVLVFDMIYEKQFGKGRRKDWQIIGMQQKCSRISDLQVSPCFFYAAKQLKK